MMSPEVDDPRDLINSSEFSQACIGIVVFISKDSLRVLNFFK
jgi:hypothetical protein